MKKKLFVMLLTIFLGSICLSAGKKTYVDLGGVHSELNQKIDLKRISFHIDLGVGNSIEAGFHIQRNFNRYITWDIVSLRFDHQFEGSPLYDTDRESMWGEFYYATTDFRAFTPGFGKQKNMKGYIVLGVGVGGYSVTVKPIDRLYHDNDYHDQGVTPVLTAEIGMYLSKHFSLGVSCTQMEYGLPLVGRLSYNF